MSRLRKRTPDWSRPLPRPLQIPDVMTLRTLGDVRTLFAHLPAACRESHVWIMVAKAVAEASLGLVEPMQVHAHLWLAFQIEQIECRPDATSAGPGRAAQRASLT